GYDGSPLERWLAERGYAYRIVREDTYSIVKEKLPEESTYCSLCSRLRRGILYTVATELRATKIALGHHRDDAIETLLLNLFYAGQLKSMPPRLVSDDGRNVVIRPLIYASEEDLAAFAEEKRFPIVPCDLCGSQEHLQRKRMKELVASLARENPHVRNNLFAALGNVRPSHLLDARLRSALAASDPSDGDPVDAPAVVPLTDLVRAR
ncbi:MAG TPA: tRNA 2-thiocytidine(32) synthetase TtcA, partial [Polyangiaceae bacterium]|nr:tRNA 2-thiocytidine(32) synthetase TtcA [Polyangiaceae bacterium]